MPAPPTIGAILAGGLSRRMGGGDKPFLMLGDRPLAAHVAGRLAPQCAAVVLNANADLKHLPNLGLPVVPDDVAGFAGPLAGILAVLEWAARERPAIGWVVSVPGDTPFIPGDLVAGLHAAREEAAAEMACAASAGRRHAAVALWPVAVRDALRQALVEEGERAVSRFQARYSLAAAHWPSDPVDPFFNVNTPDDLAEAGRMLARLRPTED